MPEHGEAGQVERADVIERADDEQSRLGAEPQRDRLVRRLPVEIIVREHHALGTIGRARGIHQPHQVGWRATMHRRGRHIACEMRHALLRGVVEHDNPGARGIRSQFLVDDQKPCAGIAGDVADLVAGETEVDRQEHRAEMAGGEDQLQERRAVLHQHRHDVAGADALRGEPACHHSDTRIERRVGDLLAAIFQRGPVRRAPGMKGDEARKIDHFADLGPVIGLASSLDEF